jgi:hypothetical protein
MHSSEHSSGNMQVSKFVQLESWRGSTIISDS